MTQTEGWASFGPGASVPLVRLAEVDVLAAISELLVLLLILFAVVGGFAVNNWLFVILLIALILVGYV